MSPALIAVLLLAALVVWPGARGTTGSRLRVISADGRAEPAGSSGPNGSFGPAGSCDPTGPRAPPWRAGLFASAAGAAVAVSLPGRTGAVLALLVLAGSFVVLRAAPTELAAGPTQMRGTARPADPVARWIYAGLVVARRLAARRTPDPLLPFAIDLLAVCLRAGMPVSRGLRAVAATMTAVSGADPGRRRIARMLDTTAATLELGGDSPTAWRRWLDDPGFAPLARSMSAAGESGSSVAARLATTADRLRVGAGQQAQARANRVGVALMAPLGLCFLPAFICLGIVPVIIGLAGRVFG